ncbi:MAG: GDP-mannose 4,6-dehydratase [Chloroflexi bacterium]|nr:GDP-mannose 4,6-dehydratase [Chloroflexota bacterium]
MCLSNKRVLVTGSGGFVASHLVERLAIAGNEVSCMVRYNSRNDSGLLALLQPSLRNSLEILSGDLRDSDFVRASIRSKDIVFHLAALIAIPYSYSHPREVVETNVLGTLNVLAAAREIGVERVIHTSTSEVYGTAQYVPIDERHPLQAQSPYAASKIGADKLAESFFMSYGLPVVTVRPFNVYGPRQSARAVIPTIISQALQKKSLTLGSTSPTRDFTYVTDTVEGFLKAATSDQAVNGHVINIGSNLEVSIGDLVQKVSSLLGHELAVSHEPERVRPPMSEVERLLADNSLARTLLGWEPKVPLDDGLQMTIEWISRHLDRYEPHKYVY